MTSIQRKFAAGLISLFAIPATNYIGQSTRLTPDDFAEPIYEFTQIGGKAAPPPPTVKYRGHWARSGYSADDP